jgi:Ca2+-binding RTX toxin-like protein
LTGSPTEATAFEFTALNSNSFITSILYHTGFDPAANMPTNLGVTPGLETLLDIAGAHSLSAAGYFSDIAAGDGDDTVTGDGFANDLFGGSGADRIAGGNGNDLLFGDTGNDVLNAGSGADNLFGGPGNDALFGSGDVDFMWGGAGIDRFDFNAITESGVTGAASDFIRDFQVGTDRIDLSTIDANSLASGNQAFTFIGSSAFTALGQARAVVNLAGTLTIVSLNVQGNTAADMIIRFEGDLSFTASDFIL